MPPAWHYTFLFLFLLAFISLSLGLPTQQGSALCQSRHCSLLSEGWCQCRSPRNRKAVFRLRATTDDFGGESEGDEQKVKYVLKCPISEQFLPKLDVEPFGISFEDCRSLDLHWCTSSSNSSRNLGGLLASLNVSESKLTRLALYPVANLTVQTFQQEPLLGLKALTLKGLSLNVSEQGSQDVLQPLAGTLQQLKIVNSKLQRFPEGLFSNLRNLTKLTIAHNADLLSPAMPQGLFADLGSSLQKLVLEDNSLQELPKAIFSKLHNLQELDLSHNHFESLEPDLLQDCENLESFVLLRDSCPVNSVGCSRIFDGRFLASQTSLSEFSYSAVAGENSWVNSTITKDLLDSCSSTIKIFQVKNAQIASGNLGDLLHACSNLTQLVAASAGLNHLNLSSEALQSLESANVCNNKDLDCSCDKNLNTLSSWVRDGLLGDFEQCVTLRCDEVDTNSSSSSLASNATLTLSEALTESNCRYVMLAGMGHSTTSSTLMTALLAVTLVITLVLFLVSCRRGQHKKSALSVSPDFAADDSGSFDAFLSYSEHDAEFAHGVRRELELRGVRVCYHEEHFDLALPVSENILAKVSDSRWLLLVLSPGFLASEWCLRELGAAVGLRKRVLVLFRDGGMTDEALESAPSQVRDYVRQHTYLKEGDAKFQEKLLKAVKVRRPEEQSSSSSSKMGWVKALRRWIRSRQKPPQNNNLQKHQQRLRHPTETVELMRALSRDSEDSARS